jgi:hypothetical protein
MEFIVFGAEINLIQSKQPKRQVPTCTELILSSWPKQPIKLGLDNLPIWLLLKIGGLRMMPPQEMLPSELSVPVVLQTCTSLLVLIQMSLLKLTIVSSEHQSSLLNGLSDGINANGDTTTPRLLRTWLHNLFQTSFLSKLSGQILTTWPIIRTSLLIN